MTTGRIEEEMTHEEFRRWQALSRFEAFGESRLDVLMALGAAYAMLPWRDKDAGPLDWTKLVPDWEGTREKDDGRQSPEQMRVAAMQIVAQAAVRGKKQG